MHVNFTLKPHVNKFLGIAPVIMTGVEDTVKAHRFMRLIPCFGQRQGSSPSYGNGGFQSIDLCMKKGRECG
jgi:hypothetical protein